MSRPIEEKYSQLTNFFKEVIEKFYIYDNFDDNISSKLSIIIANEKNLSSIPDSSLLENKINKILNIKEIKVEDLINKINDLYQFLDDHNLFDKLYSVPIIDYSGWETFTGKDGKQYVKNQADDPEYKKREKEEQFSRLHTNEKDKFISLRTISNIKFTNIYDLYNPILKVKEQVKVFSSYLLNYSSKYTTTMIGIFGKWGRGKTLFCDELFKELSLDKNLYFCKFQPWKYKEKESLWAYLYENLLESYINNDKYDFFNEIRKIFKLNIKRLGLFSFSYGLIIFCFLVTFFLSSFQFKLDILMSIITSSGVSLIFLIFKLYTLFIKSKNVTYMLYNKYGKKKDYSEYLGFQNEIEKELKVLINTFIPKGKKLVLFIDDLDRCDEEIIIDVMDSLRLVLEDTEINDKLMIICAVDQEILLNSINYKYFTKDINTINSKEYIEKFFLLGIKLGNLNADDINNLVEFYSEELNKLARIEDNQVITEETTSNSKDGNEVKTNQKIQLKKHNISSQNINILNNSEIKIIKQTLVDKKIKTPRSVNIMIQRYLLFKSFIFKEFSFNQYKSFQDRLLILLVINSSNPKFITNILNQMDDKKNMIYLSSENSNLKLTTKEKYIFKIDIKDFKILLQYSEMVNPF